MKIHATPFVGTLLLGLVISCSVEKPDRPMASRYDELYRPQFHFSPAENWMNDPNGLVYLAGEYHLFYQYNPEGTRWGHMSWGHAVSPDLLHWEHLPVALSEQPGYMIFSGSAVIDWNNSSGLGTVETPPLVAIFTAAAEGNQSQSIAVSQDRGRTFEEYPGNPVIDLGEADFRDPKVFWYEPGQEWIMVVSMAAALKVQFYASKDLRQWQLLSEFGPAGAQQKPNWECPDLFPVLVDGQPGVTRWVLKVDLGANAIAGGSGGEYFVGGFDGKEFRPDSPIDVVHWVDYGPDFYASQSWSDIPAEDGRRIWVGWMNNWAYAQDIPTHPWRSAQSIPRSLSLKKRGENWRLAQEPVVELQQLRIAEGAFYLEGKSWKEAAAEIERARVAGDLLEIRMSVSGSPRKPFGLSVREGEQEETRVGVQPEGPLLFLDRSESGDASFYNGFGRRFEAPLSGSLDGGLDLHLFVDSSSVEVFADDGTAVITAQIFPRRESTGVSLFGEGDDLVVDRLEIWKLGSVWRETARD